MAHLEALENLSRSRVDAPQIALVTFPGAVPELSVHPGVALDTEAWIAARASRWQEARRHWEIFSKTFARPDTR